MGMVWQSAASCGEPEDGTQPGCFSDRYDASYSAAEALEAGGDDFIRKPFVMRELSAKFGRILRGQHECPMTLFLRCPRTYQVFVDNREVRLTRVEFDLLPTCAANPRNGMAPRTADECGIPSRNGDTAQAIIYAICVENWRKTPITRLSSNHGTGEATPSGRVFILMRQLCDDNSQNRIKMLVLTCQKDGL
jgi:hypothetical protein